VPESGCGIIMMSNGARGDSLSFEILFPAVEEHPWPAGQWRPC
jgi:hypothetical protein